jgi:hypothetical protein
MDLTHWDEPFPGSISFPSNDAEWLVAFNRYWNSRNDEPLKRCIQVARDNEAKTVVIETRYIDIDYRSEYSAYFSRLFASVPDTAHRIHFFGTRLDPSRLWNLPSDPDYLGYVTIRPARNGLISRAMLKPPPDIAVAVRATATEVVSFFGQHLSITGTPFTQQDTQLGACAHAAAWMCYHLAYLRGEVSRRSSASFSLLADASLQPKRALPSSGLTVEQLSEISLRQSVAAGRPASLSVMTVGGFTSHRSRSPNPLGVKG